MGKPVIFVGGFGTSRLTRHPDDTIATSLGIRLITIDGPGTGLSSPASYPRLVDWGADLRVLLETLHLVQPALLGWSLGAPSVLAAAAASPDRFSRVGIVAGLALFNRPGAVMGGKGPVRWMPLERYVPVWLVQLYMYLLARQGRRHPERQVSPRYRADPPMLEMPMASTREAWRQGSVGIAWDDLRVARPWGVRLESIAAPTSLWYGGQDTVAPPHMGRYLAGHIPGAHLQIYPNAGHELIFDYRKDILQTLA
jgi:pimeloyl-ACP methyl ester carboxylesterase